MRNMKYIRNVIVISAFSLLFLCSCSQQTAGNKTESENTVFNVSQDWQLSDSEIIYKSDHAVCYRTGLNSPYENYSFTYWYVFDDDGNIIYSDKGGRVDPHIEEYNGIVSVYMSAGTGTGTYREFFTQTGGMSAVYQRNTVSEIVIGNDKISGEFLYTSDGGYFDYNEICRKYSSDSAGIRKSGFINNDDSLIHNSNSAFSRALNELNDKFRFNVVTTEYDDNNDMWAVTFSQKDISGDCMTVYLDAYGRTQLMVSGE